MIEYIKRSPKKVKITHASRSAKRLYIPTDIANDSNYPVPSGMCVVSIVKASFPDGTIRTGIFDEEAPTMAEEEIY